MLVSGHTKYNMFVLYIITIKLIMADYLADVLM